jgi:hypothetical protein
MTGIPVGGFSLTDLETKGYVTRIGVTPTDILAAEGSFTDYDPSVSERAVAMLASKAGMDTDIFIREVKQAIVDKICGCIEDHLSRSADDGSDMPLVGIGAPVGAWLPAVAERFGIELILPENYDVGNAIGAISSSVTEVVEVQVRAGFQDFSDKPECTVYNGSEAFEFAEKDEAIEFALKEASRMATERAKASGAFEVKVDHRIEEVLIDVHGKGKKVFRGATVIARASGKPMMLWFR